ncbi:MAG: hypothetical protein P8Y36_08305, partial [Alphaproteobacteria bacterium]
VKRKLVDWSGIRDKARAYRDIKKRPASSGRWASAVVVGGRHTRITPTHYGARWKRGWPGVKHRAWKRTQTAKGSFLAKNPKGGGQFLAWKRVSKARMPVVPLFGPSMPREIERHESDVQALVNTVTQQYIIKEAQRLMERALAKAARK